jgi:hypothetical protein
MTRQASFCAVDPSHLFSRVVVQNSAQNYGGLGGAEKSAPESIQSGYANPAQSTTSEIGVSGGGSRPLYGGCHMATTPTQKLPKFTWLFLGTPPDALPSASLPTVSKKPASFIPAGILSLPPKFALNVRFINTQRRFELDVAKLGGSHV